MSNNYARYSGISGSGGGGVSSLNGETGAITITGSNGITITTPSSNTIDIGGSGGTVTSVGLALPASVFSVSGSPVTSSGTLTGSFISQSANLVLASPNGSSGVPTFRSLVAADIPSLSSVYANVNLSNLASPTAINQNLLPNAGSTFNLGSNSAPWADVNANELFVTDGSNRYGQLILNGSTPSGVSLKAQLAFPQNSGPAGIFTGSNATTPTLYIETGNASAGNSGDLSFKTGSATGTRGQLQFRDGSEGTAGYIWTSTDTVGHGNWAVAPASGVTSVALADSTGLFNITGSPITSSGTLTLASFQSQAQNSFFAGPSGSSGAPTFRAITPSDVPSIQVNTTFQVDGLRTDSYTADGSLQRPFKTIGAAIAKVISNGDNASKPYTICIAPATYTESLSFNDASLVNLSFVASPVNVIDGPFTGVLVTGGPVIQSSTNNTQLSNLAFSGITFAGNVTLIGDVNGTNFGSTEILFTDCNFELGLTGLTLTNINNVNFYGCQMQGPGAVSTFTNLAFAYIEGGEGISPSTTVNLVQDNSGNQPAQAGGNFVEFNRTSIYGHINSDAGSTLVNLEMFYGSLSAVVINGAAFSWATNWSSVTAVTLNSGASLRCRGDFFYLPPVINSGATLTSQGIFTAATADVLQVSTRDSTTSSTLTIKTGDASSGNSGGLQLKTGTASGTRGKIQLQDGSEGTSGNIWTSTDTIGNGHWAAAPTNAINQLTGDATAGPGSGSQVLTLATVNGNVGSFGSSTSIPSFTVNAKGLITAASGNAVIAPAGTLSGTTLNATVVSSSLTSVGTITTGVWNGTKIDETHGGTNQSSYTTGDTLYASASNTLSKLAIGTAGQFYSVVGGIPAWTSTSPASAINSFVQAWNGNGQGATGTTTRCFSNSTSNGSDITYTPDTTNGDTFTINTTGLYSVQYRDALTAGSGSTLGIGATVNSSGTSTNIASLTAGTQVPFGYTQISEVSGDNISDETSGVLYLNSGDIIRGQTIGAPGGTGTYVTDNRANFRITRIL